MVRYTIAPSLPPLPFLFSFHPFALHITLSTRLLEPGINGSNLLDSSKWPQAKFPTDCEHLCCAVLLVTAGELLHLRGFLNPLCCLLKWNITDTNIKQFLEHNTAKLTSHPVRHRLIDGMSLEVQLSLMQRRFMCSWVSAASCILLRLQNVD